MPCPACDRTYYVPPCKHETGILITKDRYLTASYADIPGIFRVATLDCTIVFHVEAYKELHFNCPCKECLVKVVCDAQFDERCPEYINIIDKLWFTYYDESYGQLRRTPIRGR